jgi:hypothetical protein
VKALALVLLASGCGVLLSPSAPPSRAPVLAIMEKGGCLGECPVYDLTFYADGTVAYHGEYDVMVKGRRWFRIDAATLKGALQYDFGIARWNELPEHGDVECTDQQTVTFHFGGKRVVHDYGDSHAPDELTSLESDLDRR